MDGAQDSVGFDAFGGANNMQSGIGMGMGMGNSHSGHNIAHLDGGNHIGNFNDLGMDLSGSYDMVDMPASFTNTMSSNDLSFTTEQEMLTPSKSLADDTSRLDLDSTEPFNHRGSPLFATAQKLNPRLQVSSKAAPRRTVEASELSSSIEQGPKKMQRTPRGASQSAKQNIAQRIQVEKQLDMENGERSSEEDSATSEFLGDDDEYV